MWKAVLGAFVEARVYVAAAYIVSSAVTNRLQPAPAFSPLSDGLLAWDGRWYELIAAHGYGDASDPAVRFFPLWPMLGRALAPLWRVDPGIALVIAANLLALLAAVLLYRLVIDETDDPDTAALVVRLFAVAPPSFVLVFAYSEALFVTLSLVVVLAARKSRWWSCCVAGFLAGLTRPVGALLAVAVACAGFLARSQSRLQPKRARIPVTVAIVSPIVGGLAYLFWAGVALGDATAPIDHQRALRGGVREPVSRLIGAGYNGIRGDSGELLHFLSAVMIIALAVVALRKLGPSLSVYGAATVVVLLAAENLNSLERYALAAFPLVIAAGVMCRHRLIQRWLPLAAGPPMLCLSLLAFHGVYVP